MVMSLGNGNQDSGRGEAIMHSVCAQISVLDCLKQNIGSAVAESGPPKTHSFRKAMRTWGNIVQVKFFTTIEITKVFFLTMQELIQEKKQLHLDKNGQSHGILTCPRPGYGVGFKISSLPIMVIVETSRLSSHKRSGSP